LFILARDVDFKNEKKNLAITDLDLDLKPVHRMQRKFVHFIPFSNFSAQNKESGKHIFRNRVLPKTTVIRPAPEPIEVL
jgi:hypothetical protein